MSTYDLDTAPEQFDFTLGGHLYSMKYPTSAEMQAIVDQSAKIKDLLAQVNAAPDDKALAKQLTAAAAEQGVLYGLVTTSDPEAPSFEDAMKSVRLSVLKAFQRMIETELSIEG